MANDCQVQVGELPYNSGYAYAHSHYNDGVFIVLYCRNMLREGVDTEYEPGYSHVHRHTLMHMCSEMIPILSRHVYTYTHIPTCIYAHSYSIQITLIVSMQEIVCGGTQL